MQRRLQPRSGLPAIRRTRKQRRTRPKSEPAAETAAPDAKSAETDVAPAESVKAGRDKSASDRRKSEASAEAEDNPTQVNAEAPTAAITDAETPRTEAPRSKKPRLPKADPKPAESKAAEKPAEPVKAAADTPAAPAAAPDAKKDTARLPGADKAARAEPPRRPGQIAVFVSRKDSKLYVRENFKPQFDVPITIAPSDRPLGTHVFTAEADKKDPNLLRWSVVSLPVTARNAARTDEDDRAARRRKVAGGAAEAKPLPAPNSPAEALDRITIAPEAMARIAEVLTTGSSIVVSDHGINQGGETGEGTDFIVPLR